MRRVCGETVVKRCDCAGRIGEIEEGGEGRDDGLGCYEGVAKGAAVDESVFEINIKNQKSKIKKKKKNLA